VWPKKRIKKKWQVIPKVRTRSEGGRHERRPKEKCRCQKKI